MFATLVYHFLHNVVKISKLDFSIFTNLILMIFNAFKCALLAL
jgi:hypothetical protein